MEYFWLIILLFSCQLTLAVEDFEESFESFFAQSTPQSNNKSTAENEAQSKVEQSDMRFCSYIVYILNKVYQRETNNSNEYHILAIKKDDYLRLICFIYDLLHKANDGLNPDSECCFSSEHVEVIKTNAAHASYLISIYNDETNKEIHFEIDYTEILFFYTIWQEYEYARTHLPIEIGEHLSKETSISILDSASHMLHFVDESDFKKRKAFILTPDTK